MGMFWAILVSSGCAGQQSNMNSLSPAGAGATVAVAVVAQAAVGCNFQGCPYGSFCNKETRFCEQRKCSAGCPDNTICNEGLNLCQAPPPPSTPNDFLPQDNRVNEFPTL